MGCNKDFASEGALNLHIKEKHNGGNKTEREKLAKQIVWQVCHLKKFVHLDKLDINIPPGGVREAVEQLQAQHKDLDIPEDAIVDLEKRLFKMNQLCEKRSKEKELEKKEENEVKANMMIE